MVVKFSSLLHFQPIHFNIISNERYLIGELKFMLPLNRINLESLRQDLSQHISG